MLTKDQIEPFVKALTLAWKRLGLYPPNHPARQGALEAPVRQLSSLLAIENPISIAATEDALLVHQERLESLPAVELARALYRHNVGVIRFGSAVTNAHLEQFSTQLRATGSGSAHGSLVATFGPGRLAEFGIELEPVDYSGLVEQQDEGDARVAQLSLLERLLQLQLNDQPFLESKSTTTDFEGFVLLLRNHVATLRQQSTLLGSLRADFAEQLVEVIEEQLVEGTTAGFHVVDLDHLRRVLLELPGELRSDVLSGLLTRLLDSDSPEALAALESASASADLLAAIRRLRKPGIAFSAKAQRMAEQLAAQRKEQPGSAEWSYDLQSYGNRLRRKLPALALSTLDDPIQPLLRFKTQSDAPTSRSADLEQMFETLAPEEQRQAMLTSLLELVELDVKSDHLPPEQLEAILNRLASTFHELIVTGHVNAASAVIVFLKQHYGPELNANSPMVAAALTRFRGERLVSSVLEAVSLATSTDSYPSLQALIKSTSADVARRLVVKLSETEDRRTRRRLFDFLLPLKALVLDDIRALLSRTEWFHVRNGVALLNAMGDGGSVPRIRALATTPDIRVRDAVVRFLLQHDNLIPVEILDQWINSEDEQFAIRVIQLLGRHRQWNAVEPLLELLAGADTFRRQRAERAAAITALAHIADPDAGERLARQFEGNLRLQHPDERRLFYETLVHYPADDRRSVLERGLRSRDAAIRHICEQVRTGETAS